MYECGTCGKAFRAGLQAREQHCDATGHSPPRFECDSCDAYFRSERAMLQHMSATGHFDDDSNYDDDSDYGVECTHCDLTFDTLDQREDHEVEDHFYCHDCDRTFVNYGAIEMVGPGTRLVLPVASGWLTWFLYQASDDLQGTPRPHSGCPSQMPLLQGHVLYGRRHDRPSRERYVPGEPKDYSR